MKSNRNRAREAGEKKYKGSPCAKCGSKIRWVSACACVRCSLENTPAKKKYAAERYKRQLATVPGFLARNKLKAADWKRRTGYLGIKRNAPYRPRVTA